MIDTTLLVLGSALIGFAAGGMLALAATARDIRRHERARQESGPRPERCDAALLERMEIR